MTALATLPLEVKEIIAQLLDKKALCSCVRVSRTFHALFLPFLWQNIRLNNSHKRDPSQGSVALAAHASLVTDLVVIGPLPEEYYTISYPHLKTLKIESFSYPPDLTLLHVALVRANPMVQDLTLYKTPSKPTNEFWEVIENEWIRPRSLDVVSHVVEPGQSDAFWRACSRFETLSIISDDIPFFPTGYKDSSTPSQQQQPPVDVFPHIERLTLNFHPVGHGARPDHVDWIRRCPRLVYLAWNLVGRRSPVKRLAAELKNATWPVLSSLRLEQSMHTDRDLSDLVSRLPYLRILQFSQSTFGPLSFAALKAHPQMRSLHTLSVLSCPGFTGSMAQAVLEQCPVLDTFAAPYISVHDVAQEGSQPWACVHSLRFLTVYVTCGPQSTIKSRQKMFDQLGLLSNIIHLDLGAHRLFQLPLQVRSQLTTYESTLSLKLSSDNGGLANFVGLTQLRHFSFKQTPQSLGMKEVHWVLDHWTHLSKIVGQFTNTGIPFSRLLDLFLQNGISFHE
ncbi:hypothetical protein BGZ97_000858 [Linnemannia gamsii]|jgi:hypothetical protein|uniref:F-box domain-containing protein n=1 Tax=Linnemannia gamsii TaxID=64522 RepID=A0A9P6UJV5_9FUNG|nr:hypothetical protein BGZ97_000858 [Linnemannia gamsii]